MIENQSFVNICVILIIKKIDVNKSFITIQIMSKYRAVENTRTNIEKEKRKLQRQKTKIMDDNKYKERE